MEETPETFGRCDMDSEAKSHWIAALRSGHYKQGHRVLRSTDNAYCCLGVLCNLEDPNAWDNLSKEGYAESCYRFNYNGKSVFGALPANLLIEKKIPNWAHSHLIHMNDSGSSFDEIADWIEDNL